MDMLDVEDLFGAPESPGNNDDADENNRDDANDRRDDDIRSRDSGGEEEEEEGAQLDLQQGQQTQAQLTQQEGGEEKKKKRILNPMPKFDPDRICGKRGINVLEEVFKDFTPKGKGHEYDDLAVMMKKMEHWAHRLYPRLPFDDVMDRIAFLGRKATVKTYVRKMRLGMINSSMPTTADVVSDEEGGGGDERERQGQGDEEVDTARRYDNDFPDDEDIFDQLARQIHRDEDDDDDVPRGSSPDFPPAAAAVVAPTSPSVAPAAFSTISEDVRARMLQNKRLAEERRRSKIMSQASQPAKVAEDDVREDGGNVGVNDDVVAMEEDDSRDESV